jgi:broad specificity phosphatase PhoE
MHLLLIRHGETRWNEAKRFQGISDIELSAKGFAQANSLAQSLRNETLAAIYTSPLIRARQTAECIARGRTCPFVVEEGLKELNQGRLEGLTAEELRKDFPDFFAEWLKDPGTLVLPGGESLGELQNRAWSAMERLIPKHSQETIVVVAHSFVILTILCRVLDLPLQAFRRFRQDPTAKNVLEFTERGVILKGLNDTCHLHGTR